MIQVKKVENFLDDQYDCVVVISDTISNFDNKLESVKHSLLKYKEYNSKLESSVVVVPFDHHPSKKIIFSPIISLDDDYDDSRRIYEASNIGIKTAIEMGSKQPMLIIGNFVTLPKDKPKWTSREYIELNILLGALFAAYVPIEIREDVPSRAKKLNFLGAYGVSEKSIFIATALENGRIVTRDISGSDPERMTAINIVKYINEVFLNSSIIVQIEKIDKSKYPLMEAVNRAGSVIPRHDGRIAKFIYDSKDEIEETVFLVGKGITYDSGGADVKINGNMSGMHRDKSGAGAITGLFKALEILKPKKIKVVGLCAYVRNSIGENSYVADEIITSRSGKRVRVGNTDAEGRMVMADLLCEAKEMAVSSINPSLFTIATLTGHVRRTYGLEYTAVMGNGSSCDRKIPLQLQEAGNLLSEPVEISTVRREDMEFHKGFYEYEDVLQCNYRPSNETSRGHQSPAAFLMLASGLDKHTKSSSHPLSYTHLDIAGSGGKIGALPTAVPLLMFSAIFILPRIL